MQITAATPKMIPNDVSSERSLCSRTLLVFSDRGQPR
jgi:hypothetical protein